MNLWLHGGRFPPAWLAKRVLALRQRLHRLADALVPAQLVVSERAMGLGQTMALSVAAQHGIADALETGPRSARELAEARGLDADALERTLRALCTVGVFARRADGRFANTRLSRALGRDAFGTMRPFAMYLASASNVAAWSDFAEVVRTGKNGFERVHGADIWSWFGAHPEERAQFAAAMNSLTEMVAPALASAYPWQQLHRLCDVGGGRGQLLAAILRRHAELRGVLCDAPEVLELARAHLASLGLLERVEPVPGSFFDAVPAGCDAYLLKDILHDWDDARCLRILERVRAAMPSGARLVIAEVLVEPHDAIGPGPWSDVQMLTVCCEGRQRSLAQLHDLLRAAGLRPARVFHTAVLTSLIEAVAP